MELMVYGNEKTPKG